MTAHSVAIRLLSVGWNSCKRQVWTDVVPPRQYTSLWYTGGIHSFMVATPQPLTRAEVLALGPHIEAAGIGDDLGDGQKLVGDFLMDTGAVARYVESARLVTDDSAFFIPAKETDAILQGWAPYAQVSQAGP